MSQPPPPPWAQPPGPQQTPYPRMARLFDSVPPGGRPVVQRPPVALHERDALLTYLKQAPVVLSARGFDEDQMDPSRPAEVPLSFHTDGTWVWPGAVGYHLRVHNVPPEPELVAHIRAHGFRVPGVSEAAEEAAIKVATGQVKEPEPAQPPAPAAFPPPVPVGYAAPPPPAPGMAVPPPFPPPPVGAPHQQGQGKRIAAGCLSLLLVLALFVGFRVLKTATKRGLSDDRPSVGGSSLPYDPPSATPGASSPPDAQGKVVTSLPPLCDAVKGVLPAKARQGKWDPSGTDGPDRRFCRWRTLNAKLARDLSVTAEFRQGDDAVADMAKQFARDWDYASGSDYHQSRERLTGLGDEAFATSFYNPIVSGKTESDAKVYRKYGARLTIRRGNVLITVSWTAADGYRLTGRVYQGTYLPYRTAKADADRIARKVLLTIP